MIYYNRNTFFIVLGIITVISLIGAIIQMIELWTFGFGLMLGMMINSFLAKEEEVNVRR